MGRIKKDSTKLPLARGNASKKIIEKAFTTKKKNHIKLENGDAPHVKRPHRWKPGTVALREIKHEQRKVELSMPKAPFQRLVREIAQDIVPDIRFSRGALAAAQTATEQFLIELMADSQVAACHAKRITINDKDMQVVCHLQHIDAPSRPSHANEEVDDHKFVYVEHPPAVDASAVIADAVADDDMD